MTGFRASVWAALLALCLTGQATADTCPPIPNNSGYFNVYVEYDIYGDLKGQAILADLKQVCNAVIIDANHYLGMGSRPDTTYGLWAMCMKPGTAMDEYFTRPAGLPGYANFCPRNAKPSKAAGKSPPAAPAKAKCKKKDIEGKWRRAGDGAQVSIVGMFRGGGGSGLVGKYFGGIDWPKAVAKFYTVKQIGDSCDFKARCTTIYSRHRSKSYNFSAVPCTLRLSADKKRLTTSDGSGTWTRGWK